MPKWRVWAEKTKTTRSYIDVEANTQDEAWEKAGEANKLEYKIDDTYTKWEMERPYRLYDDDVREFKVGERVMVIPHDCVKKKLWNAFGIIKSIDPLTNEIKIDFEKESLSIYSSALFTPMFIIHAENAN